MGFLGVRFEVREGKITPCLKLVRIVLETWNLVRKYQINFTDVCTFLQKISFF